MLIRVLGSAAGGGLPQWNCGCDNCADARGDAREVEPRTQESIAVSADGRAWALVNASPDIGRQIAASSFLSPASRRDSRIRAIVLTNGDLDHCLGLFSLRESQSLVVYATARVRDGLVERNAIARTLARFEGQVRWETLGLDTPRALSGPDREPLGLTVTAVAAPGKLPLHLEGITPPGDEDNVGLLVEDEASGATLAHFPAVAAVTPRVREALAGADAVLFDGTFWSSDELIAAGVGTLRAEAMAHLPVGGENGSLQALGGSAKRRVYIHVNNTNPMLRRSSPERAAVVAAGWDVARDGMEITL